MKWAESLRLLFTPPTGKEIKDYWKYGTTGPSIWRAVESGVGLGMLSPDGMEAISSDLHPDILVDEQWERHCLEHPLKEGEVIDLSRLDLPSSFSDELEI